MKCLVSSFLFGAGVLFIVSTSGHPQQQFLMSDKIIFNPPPPSNQPSRSAIHNNNIPVQPLPPPPPPPSFISPLPAVIVTTNASQQPPQQHPSSSPSVEQPHKRIPAANNNQTNGNSEDRFSIPRAMLTFALDMARCRSGSQADCSGNMVFSPMSITSTLTMVLMGTSGNCYAQLRSALGYHDGTSDTDINGAYRFLMERIEKLDYEAGSSILFNVANGLFSQLQSRFSNDYITKAQNFYHSEVSELDIFRNPYGAANTINKWVADKTNGKITNILSSLPPDTQMVVANAVYFNANWADPFAPESTRREKFHVSQSETLYVPTMFQHAVVGYVDSPELGCKMIGMPYKGEELGMFILLPTEKDGLDALIRLESRLTVDAMETLFSSMDPKVVSIQLPKFRIQQKLQLKSALKDLGVTDLFSPETADLSRMTSKSGVALDNIVHQTFIEVTESGTEAAAATVLNLSRDGPSKAFVANQPFLFVIRDVPSRVPLFFGRVVRPGEAARSSTF